MVIQYFIKQFQAIYQNLSIIQKANIIHLPYAYMYIYIQHNKIAIEVHGIGSKYRK